MGVRDRHGVDSRPGLELPNLLASVAIKRDELTSRFTGEQQSAASGQYGRPDRMVGERDAPLLLPGQGIDRLYMGNRCAGRDWRLPILDELITLPGDVLLHGQMLIDAPSVHCRSINEARFRVERRMRPIFATARRGPHLYRLASAQLLANVGLDRSAGLIVNMSRPIHLLKRIRSDQLAGDAVYHIKEAVPVKLHDHLALLAGDVDIGVNQLPARVVVVGIVRGELVVPNKLAGFWPERQNRRGIEIVAGSCLRGPWRGIANAPIHQI